MLRGADRLLSQAAMVFLVPFNMYLFLTILFTFLAIFSHGLDDLGCVFTARSLSLSVSTSNLDGHDMLVPSAQTFTGVSACDLNRRGKMVAESYCVNFSP